MLTGPLGHWARQYKQEWLVDTHPHLSYFCSHSRLFFLWTQPAQTLSKYIIDRLSIQFSFSLIPCYQFSILFMYGLSPEGVHFDWSKPAVIIPLILLGAGVWYSSGQQDGRGILGLGSRKGFPSFLKERPEGVKRLLALNFPHPPEDTMILNLNSNFRPYEISPKICW